jgi:hypothetical protein
VPGHHGVEVGRGDDVDVEVDVNVVASWYLYVGFLCP